MARSEEVGLRGFPDVTDADIFLAVVETSIFPQYFGGLPRGPHMAHRAGGPVGVSEGTVDVVQIPHRACFSACGEAQTRPSLHGCTLLSVFLSDSSSMVF